jgi:hypothetical protein
MPQATEPGRIPGLDFPLGQIAAFRAGFAPAVIWEAPRRGLVWRGRDQVVSNLLREAAAMLDVRHTQLRRSAGEHQVIDEFVARFVYAGEGILNLQAAAGEVVELQRNRILVLEDGAVTRETAVETWTVLGRSPARVSVDGPRP